MRKLLLLATLLIVIIHAGTAVFTVSAHAPLHAPVERAALQAAVSSPTPRLSATPAPIIKPSFTPFPSLTPTVTPVPYNQADVFVLRDLGFVDAKLIGPFASSVAQFTVPPDWVFSQPGSLVLKYDVAISYRETIGTPDYQPFLNQ